MRIVIEVEQAGAVIHSAACEAAPEELVEQVIARVASELSVSEEEILSDLGVGGVVFVAGTTVEHCAQHGHKWRHRRVCIDLHFESEDARHHFPTRSKWSRVHEWGCHHFQVARDACANLELRDGAPNGPALNDHKEIGHFHGCRGVWLIKPGPERNG